MLNIKYEYSVCLNLNSHFYKGVFNPQTAILQFQVLVSEWDTERNSYFFQRHFHQLREELSKLKPPEGLEDLAEPAFQLTSSPPASTLQSAVDSKEASPVVGSSSQGFAPFGATGGLANDQKHSVEENLNHDIDTDIEMEKMVSKVCE